MNVLSYFINADARQFLQAVRGARSALRQLDDDAKRANQRGLTFTGGGAFERADLGGRSMNIRRSIGEADEAVADRITALVGKIVGVAMAVAAAFGVGRKIGEKIRDLFEEVEARIIEARTKVVQEGTRIMRGKYVVRGGVQHDVEKATAAGREGRRIEDAEGAAKVAAIDRAIQRRQASMENVRKNASDLYVTEGDTDTYKARIAEIAKSEEEIAELLRRRRDAEKEILAARWENEEAQSRYAADWQAAEGERADFELSRKSAEEQIAAKRKQLAAVEGQAIQTPESYREATELRKQLAELDDELRRRAEEAARQEAEAREKRADAMMRAAEEAARAAEDEKQRARRVAEARSDLARLARPTGDWTDAATLSREAAARSVGAYRSPLEDLAARQCDLLQVIADNSQGPRSGGK